MRDRAGEREQGIQVLLREADDEDRPGRPRRPRLSRRVEFTVLAQDGRVQIAEHLPWLDSELVHEQRTRVAVHRKRFRLPS